MSSELPAYNFPGTLQYLYLILPEFCKFFFPHSRTNPKNPRPLRLSLSFADTCTDRLVNFNNTLPTNSFESCTRATIIMSDDEIESRRGEEFDHDDTCQLPAFVSKLLRMISDPNCRDTICWGDNGTTIVIPDQAAFTTVRSEHACQLECVPFSI